MPEAGCRDGTRFFILAHNNGGTLSFPEPSHQYAISMLGAVQQSIQGEYQMPDDPGKRGPADRNRINVNERWEVDWWTRELGVTKGRLADAVNKVGPMVDKVREELKKKK
jgi:hypothetical protein